MGKTTFGQANEEMVTEIRQEDEVMAAHKEQMEKLKRIEKAKILPVIKTEDSDGKTGEQTLPRINTDNTDQTGVKKEQEGSALIATEDTDRNEGIAKILLQPVGLLEGFAGLDRSTPGCAAPSR